MYSKTEKPVYVHIYTGIKRATENYSHFIVLLIQDTQGGSPNCDCACVVAGQHELHNNRRKGTI